MPDHPPAQTVHIDGLVTGPDASGAGIARQQLDASGEARERLLLAGYLLIAEQGHQVLEAGLTPDTISRTAGRSRRSFYDHFESKGDYLDALFERFVAQDPAVHLSHAMLEIVETLMTEAEGDMVRALATLGSTYESAGTASPSRHLQLVAASMSTASEEHRHMLAEAYQVGSDLYMRVYDRLLTDWGFRLRDPWTTESLALMLRALGDGLALRRRIDPESVDPNAFRNTLLTLFPTLVEFADRPATTVVEAVEAIAVEAQTRWSERRNPASVVNAREQVNKALRELLGRVGYRTINLDMLAMHSQVSQQTILRSMGGVDEVLCGLFSDYVTGLESLLEIDIENSAVDPALVLDRHLDRLGQLTLEQGPIMRALSVIALDRERSPAHAVYAATAKVTQRALDAVLAASDEPPPAEVTAALDITLVNIVVANAAVSHPDPAGPARSVARALLHTPDSALEPS
ncbi:MAG: TetR/AcrR family transcriptional regulator [Acidimicrobiales bacterium]|nr:TetR/AcrR family transcriptional regulator [Acidimicrobiales bacterium]